MSLSVSELIQATEYLKLLQTIQSARIDDDIKYDLIFSKLSKKIFETYPDFDYFDPDTSYAEDINALVNEFEHYVFSKMKKQ